MDTFHYDTANISDWQGYFEKIYRPRNEKCNIKPRDMMLNLIEDLSGISEAIREENIGAALQHLPHVLAWLCSFCSIEGIKLQDAVWEKYPDHCPYCEVSQGCVCIGKIGKLEKDKSPIKERMRKYIEKRGECEPHSLQSWLNMFKRIYGNVNAVMPIEAVVSHLFEEAGEVTKCMRRGDRDKMDEEVADVVAWICAVVMKIDTFLNEANLARTYLESRLDEFRALRESIAKDDLDHRVGLNFAEDLLWKAYERGCPICVKENRMALPCTCPCPEQSTYRKSN